MYYQIEVSIVGAIGEGIVGAILGFIGVVIVVIVVIRTFFWGISVYITFLIVYKRQHLNGLKR